MVEQDTRRDYYPENMRNILDVVTRYMVGAELEPYESVRVTPEGCVKGTVRCIRCGCEVDKEQWGVLHFTIVASYNGHMHLHCTRDGCTGYME